MTASAEYHAGLKLSAAQHLGSKNYSGKFLRPHRGRIKEIIDRLQCASVLDYGCGRGDQYRWVSTRKEPIGQTLEQYWGLTVTKYDPAYPPFAAEPVGTFDLVICTHVLGIIPVQDLDWVTDRVFGLANKAAYIVLNTGGTAKRNKARWRTANIPSGWAAEEWLGLFTKHRPAGLEVHFIARPADPAMTSGRFIITDAGLRGPLQTAPRGERRQVLWRQGARP